MYLQSGLLNKTIRVGESTLLNFPLTRLGDSNAYVQRLISKGSVVERLQGGNL